MNTSNHSTHASLEQTARMHDLAKLQALHLRSAAVHHFWAIAFARVFGADRAGAPRINGAILEQGA